MQVGGTQKANRTIGFTIIELLIVIVVIAILAVVVIVGYNGIQSQARVSSLKSELAQSVKAFETYKTTHGEAYPTTLSAAGVNAFQDATVNYYPLNSVQPAGYCLEATRQGVTYHVRTTKTTPSEGGCTVTNLLANPNAELDRATWGENSGRASARSTDWASTGAASFLTYNNSGSTTGLNFRTSLTDGVPVVAGRTHTASATFYTYNNTFLNTYIRIEWRNSGGGTISTPTEYSETLSSGKPVRISVTSVAPANAASARIWLGMPNAPVNGGFYVDDIMLTESDSAVRYADGSFEHWSWTGSANASTSTGPRF